jgi:hypothetical protein
MVNAPNKLSDTARAMLTLAATREDRLVRPPTLPAAARSQVVRSLLNNGLVEEVAAPIDDPAYNWRDADGAMLMLRATDQGLAAIGATTAPADQFPAIEAFTQAVISFLADEGCNATILEEDEARTMIEDGHANGRPAARVAGDILAWLAETEADAEESQEVASSGAQTADTATDAAVAREAAAVADALDATPVAPARANLRAAAHAVLDAWNDEANRETDIIAALEGPMATLQAAITERSARTSPTLRAPRNGTKQHQVLTLLRQPEGATVAQIAEATAWQSHTVRGFLAGLKKKGIQLEVLERVRQVGLNKTGAKGSYSIYRVIEAN